MGVHTFPNGINLKASVIEVRTLLWQTRSTERLPLRHGNSPLKQFKLLKRIESKRQKMSFSCPDY